MDRPSSRSKLLADVTAAIVANGYAVEPQDAVTPSLCKARAALRRDFIAALATDPRLYSHARHTQHALIDEVAQVRGVAWGTAQHMIGEARRLARAGVGVT